MRDPNPGDGGHQLSWYVPLAAVEQMVERAKPRTPPRAYVTLATGVRRYSKRLRLSGS